MVTHSPSHAARASRIIGLVDGALADPSQAAAIA
jgi:predicted ABC-type transport system involved in lysophospholipase L1 biosynthesis ATPase subunit